MKTTSLQESITQKYSQVLFCMKIHSTVTAVNHKLHANRNDSFSNSVPQGVCYSQQVNRVDAWQHPVSIKITTRKISNVMMFLYEQQQPEVVLVDSSRCFGFCLSVE
ncbi:uncharacterized protein LOC111088558 [Limulus polyphemus]|uniref:Uncharacterized protein LOC111088558 n=1 Tax=Limulus polyphemus TaxID=6850 RepID=A0ABM1TFU8_LIMPO|nr:uncharacterized protein LOC111088558 [Limulus polyphemus]